MLSRRSKSQIQSPTDLLPKKLSPRILLEDKEKDEDAEIIFSPEKQEKDYKNQSMVTAEASASRYNVDSPYNEEVKQYDE